jgi:hypothetical protein
VSPLTRQPGRGGVWAAGLIVAAAAGVATAHGLYQVAAAARVPTSIAWLYPLITDGLALVAYAATSRLTDTGRRYAWAIVVLAASLSGIAQAVYLAGGIAQTTTAPVGLRFGVGAWPAAAAALTAHLLHLIGTSPAVADSAALTHTDHLTTAAAASNAANVQPFDPSGVQPYNATAEHAAVQPPRTTTEANAPAVQPGRSTDPEIAAPPEANPERAESPGGAAERAESPGGAAPARDRARQAARGHYARHGRLPTASELMDLAQVARGTAGTVLKDLRDNRPALHLVNADTAKDTDQ